METRLTHYDRAKALVKEIASKLVKLTGTALRFL
jgi:hypothetical protein